MRLKVAHFPKGPRRAAAAAGIAVAMWLGTAALLSAEPVTPPSSTTAPEKLTEAQQTQLATFGKWLRDDSLSADKRRDAAGLLLNTGWQAAEGVLLEVLSNKESPLGRLAVADALIAESARNGGKPSGRFVEPLIAALSDGNESLRKSAARALAGYSEQPEVIDRLRAFLADPGKPAELRRGAVAALGWMPPSSWAIIDALVGVLDDKDRELRQRAIEALNNLTGIEINDPAARRKWVEDNRTSPPVTWISRVNQRLRQENQALRQQRETLEERLVATMKSMFESTPAPQQGELLLKYFADKQPAVRVLALALVDQAFIGKNLPVPDAVKKTVMDRLADESGRVRIAAADLVASIGEPKDAAALLPRLAEEQDPLVKTRVIKALGLLHSPVAIGPLLKLLSDANDQGIAAEAATALAAIAARSAKGPEAEQVIAALLARYGKVTADEPVARDAIIGAMADLADLRFAPICLKSLGDESASLRLACARGLGNIASLPAIPEALHGEILDALVGRLSAEPDRGVRLALIAALAKYGPGKTQLKAVFERTNANTEPDESVRKRAWDSLVDMLKSADKPTQLNWIAQWEAGTDAMALAKLVELLVAIEPGAIKSGQWTGAELSALAERLGDALVRTKRPAEAVGHYEPEYQKLRQAQSDRAATVASKYLGALLAANQGPQAIGVLKDRLSVGAAAEGAALVDALFARLRALIAGGEAGPTTALAWIEDLRKQLPEFKAAPWAEPLNKLAAQAKDAIAGASTKPE